MLLRLLAPFAALSFVVLVGTGCPPPSSPDGGGADAGSEDGGALDDAGVVDAGEDDAGAPAPEPAEPTPIEPDPPEPETPDPSEPEVPPSSLGTSYWNAIDRTQTDQPLVNALQDRLVNTHDRVGFDSLWNAYEDTDTGRGCGTDIFDIYSDFCWAPEDRCGQYNGEGQCFNREHLWPKSWWGGQEGTDAHSDLFVVVPSDGFVNGRRANLPFGEIVSANYSSANGSQIGRCSNPAVSASDCFLPVPEVRGDIARAYFYFAVRYQNEFGCCDEAAITNGDINGWQERLLRQWHIDDPVDDDERARNEAVFTLQRNRNPFIDYPNLVYGIADF